MPRENHQNGNVRDIIDGLQCGLRQQRALLRLPEQGIAVHRVLHDRPLRERRRPMSDTASPAGDVYAGEQCRPSSASSVRRREQPLGGMVRMYKPEHAVHGMLCRERVPQQWGMPGILPTAGKTEQ